MLFDWPAPPFANAQPWQRWIAAALAATTIALDLTVFRTPSLGQSWWRTVMGLAVLAAFVALGGGPRPLGLRLRPLPDSSFWWRVTLCCSAVSVALLAAAIVLASARGTWVLPPVENTRELWGFFIGGCVHAPITEDLLYHVVLCAPLAMLIGPWPTIVVSAAVFGLLHELWGKFVWIHPCVGALKGWMYLRGRCIWIMIAFHAFFNSWALVVLSVQLCIKAE